MNQITIRKEDNTETWDKELGSINGSLFLSRDWLDALRDVERKPVFFSFYRGDVRQGMLAGLERPVKNSVFKQLFFYSGIALMHPSPEMLKECKSVLMEYAKRNGYVRIIMKSYDFDGYLFSRHKDFRTFKRAEYFIDLNRSEEEIENGFNKNAKRLVKKARSEGVVYKQGYSEELLEKLVDLMNVTHEIRSSKGYGNYEMFTMPFMDKEVMMRLLQNKSAALFYAEYKGKIVSMQFTLTSSQRGYALLMGTGKEGYKTGAPTLLWHDIMFLLKKQGLSSFCLGGIPLGEENAGLVRFKRTLGAKQIISYEEFTDFTKNPLSRLNIFLSMKRNVLRVSLPWKIKKVCLNLLNLVIKDRDAY